MNKQNKINCNTDSAAKLDSNEINRKPKRKFNIKLTYLEYLKQLYAKKFPKSRQFDKVSDEDFVELSSKEPSNKIMNKTDISKKLFEVGGVGGKKSDDKENEEVDGFHWIGNERKTENLKKSSILQKLRKYILRNSKPKTFQSQRQSEDYIIDSIVLIESVRGRNPDIKMDNNFKDSLIDFTSGSLAYKAGMAQIYVSQPLDTVKVKQQTFPKLYRNMLNCFLRTYHADGIYRGLYAGTMPAVIASIAENSVLFTAYGACQKIVTFIMQIDQVDELSALGNACAGFFAAFFSSFITCPTELVKCKLQSFREMKYYVSEHSTARPIRALALTRNIFVAEGIQGFYRGLCPTFAREMPGVFCFFGGYEATREFFTKPNQTRDDIGPIKTMCAGAVGGFALAITTFPADVVKSRIQINNLNNSMLSVASDILRKEGMLAFYNGLLATILKTIPATATLFVVYEYSKKSLTNK